MVNLCIIGDYNAQSETHRATNESIALVKAQRGIDLVEEWVATRALSSLDTKNIDACIVNTGIYEDRDAVLKTLRVLREQKIPTLATCGGFQHMIIEFARNVLGLHSAGHAEFDTEGTEHIIAPLACSLRGLEGDISIIQDSQVGRLYGTGRTTERFYCSFGIHPSYVEQLHQSPLLIVGTDDASQIRITELPHHPYFIGTLFVPHARALRGGIHPLIDGLIVSATAISRPASR
jgi:CTP synthase (UTP-ammonia lyase)